MSHVCYPVVLFSLFVFFPFAFVPRILVMPVLSKLLSAAAVVALAATGSAAAHLRANQRSGSGYGNDGKDNLLKFVLPCVLFCKICNMNFSVINFLLLVSFHFISPPTFVSMAI